MGSSKSTATPSFETYGGNAPENYEKYFVPVIGDPFAEDLMGASALSPGENVLDVACGTGIVARKAAARIAPSGKVVGMDMNPGMLEVARSTTDASQIEWLQGNAEKIPLPDNQYDVVLCQLGLQFFGDKVAALSEMRRVLVPGGRLVLSVSGPSPAFFGVLGDALACHIQPELKGFVEQVFSLYQPEELKELMSRADFTEVSTESKTMTLKLPPPQEFLWQYVCSTPLAAAAAKAGPELRAAVEEDVVKEMKQHLLQNPGAVGKVSYLIASGRKS